MDIRIQLSITLEEFKEALVASFSDSLGYNEGGPWSNEAKRLLFADTIQNIETQQELFVFCTDYLDMTPEEFFLRECNKFRGVQAKTEW